MTSEAPNRLRRAEAVLQFRTSRLVLVAERCVDTHNLTAILRTAELMGIQNVYTIDQDLDISKQQRSTVSSGANFWVDVHNFKCTESCVNQLKKDGFEIWATDLGDGATSLAPSDIPPIPSKLAIVMGRETDGISDQMRALSDRLVWLHRVI
ncbi:MAG: TrmH family RNA methyltransferase [Planctomycetota bacterium]|nr:TrmH family RNA methyltransferase [Planctomycetota bacterium]